MKTPKKIFVLSILLLALVMITPFAAADSFLVGWVKNKFGISNPTHQCEISPNFEDEYCSTMRGVGTRTHICQLYEGLNPEKDEIANCDRCIRRSGMEDEYGLGCLNVVIAPSHFLGEDLLQKIADNEKKILKNVTDEMDPISSTTREYGGIVFGIYKDHDGNVKYTKDGTVYKSDIEDLLNLPLTSKKGTMWKIFHPFSLTNDDPDSKGAMYVYEKYVGNERSELEYLYDAYSDLISAPMGAGFAGDAVVTLFQHLQDDAFKKAAKKYYKERSSISAEAVYTEFKAGNLPELQFSNANKGVTQEIFFAMLEESYHRMKIANYVEANYNRDTDSFKKAAQINR